MTDITYLLPVGDTMRMSWDKVRGSKGTIWIALLILFALMFGLGFISGILSVFVPKATPFANLIVQIFGFLLNMGIMYLGIRRAQDFPIFPSFVFHAFSGWLWLKVIGLYILQVLILIIPMLLIMGPVFIVAAAQTTLNIAIAIPVCIIGVICTIYLAIRIMLAMAFVLDRESGPWEAIALSFRATKSNFWRLIGIFILQTLIILVSMIPLGIGLIWTIPFAMINYGMIYKNLSLNSAPSIR